MRSDMLFTRRATSKTRLLVTCLLLTIPIAFKSGKWDIPKSSAEPENVTHNLEPPFPFSRDRYAPNPSPCIREYPSLTPHPTGIKMSTISARCCIIFRVDAATVEAAAALVPRANKTKVLYCSRIC